MGSWQMFSLSPPLVLSANIRKGEVFERIAESGFVGGEPLFEITDSVLCGERIILTD